MAQNIISLGGTGTANYLGPEGSNRARRRALNDESAMRSNLNAAGSYQPGIISGFGQMASSYNQPSRYMGMAEGALINPKNYAEMAATEANQQMEIAKQVAEREAARRGKTLSPSDIRKLAIAGALGKSSAANRTMMGAQEARFGQLGNLERMNQINNEQARRALGDQAMTAGHLDRMRLARASAYNDLSGDEAQYYGMSNRRGGAFRNIFDPGQINMQRAIQQVPVNPMQPTYPMNNVSPTTPAVGPVMQQQMAPGQAAPAMSGQLPAAGSAYYNASPWNVQQAVSSANSDAARRMAVSPMSNSLYNQQVQQQIADANRSIDQSFNVAPGGYNTTADGNRAVNPYGKVANATPAERMKYKMAHSEKMRPGYYRPETADAMNREYNPRGPAAVQPRQDFMSNQPEPTRTLPSWAMDDRIINPENYGPGNYRQIADRQVPAGETSYIDPFMYEYRNTPGVQREDYAHPTAQIAQAMREKQGVAPRYRPSTSEDFRNRVPYTQREINPASSWGENRPVLETVDKGLFDPATGQRVGSGYLDQYYGSAGEGFVEQPQGFDWQPVLDNKGKPVLDEKGNPTYSKPTGYKEQPAQDSIMPELSYNDIPINDEQAFLDWFQSGATEERA